jgi:hypothetical protein
MASHVGEGWDAAKFQEQVEAVGSRISDQSYCSLPAAAPLIIPPLAIDVRHAQRQAERRRRHLAGLAGGEHGATRLQRGAVKR